MQNTSNFSSIVQEALDLHRKGSLEEADSYYRRAKQILKSDGASEIERRQLLQHQIRLYTSLGLHEDALKLLRELRKLCETSFGAHHVETAFVLRKLTDVLSDVGQTAEARALSGVAMQNWLMFAGCQIKEQADGNDFDALFGLKPTVPGADVLYGKIVEKVSSSKPDPVSLDIAACRALTDIAALIHRHGAMHQAYEISRFALLHFERLPVEYAWLIPECLFDYADIALSVSHTEQSVNILCKYINLFDHNFGKDNDVSADLAWAMGRCLVGERRYADACKSFERTLSAFAKWSSADNSRAIGVLCDLANCCLEGRDYARAESTYKQALKLATQIAVPNKMLLVNAHFNLSLVYVASGQLAESERVLLVGSQMVADILGPETRESSNFLRQLGDIYMLQRRYSKAMATYLRCFELLLLHMSEDREEVYEVRKQCVSAYRECGRYYDAEVTLNRMIELLEKDTSKSGILQLSWTSLELGKIQRLQGRYAQADRTLRRTLSMFEDSFGFAAVETCAVVEELAECLFASWRFAQAEKACRRIIGELAGLDRRDATELLIRARVTCASCRLLQSDPASAISLAQEAVDICRQHEELNEQLVMETLSAASRLLSAAGDERSPLALYEEMHRYLRDHCCSRDLEEDPLYACCLETQAALPKTDAVESSHPIAHLRKAIAIRERLQGQAHQSIARDYQDIALLYQDDFVLDRAEDSMFKALQILERAAGQHGMLGDALIIQSAIMHAREKTSDALALSRRALTIWEMSPPSVTPAVLRAMEGALQNANEARAQDVVSALAEHIERMKPLLSSWRV
jgi:tetratricopeptide (TPR) repeat protein